jgi:hypothetical protein
MECGPVKFNRHFGWLCCLHLQGWRKSRTINQPEAVSSCSLYPRRWKPSERIWVFKQDIILYGILIYITCTQWLQFNTCIGGVKYYGDGESTGLETRSPTYFHQPKFNLYIINFVLYISFYFENLIFITHNHISLSPISCSNYIISLIILIMTSLFPSSCDVSQTKEGKFFVI